MCTPVRAGPGMLFTWLEKKVESVFIEYPLSQNGTRNDIESWRSSLEGDSHGGQALWAVAVKCHCDITF